MKSFARLRASLCLSFPNHPQQALPLGLAWSFSLGWGHWNRHCPARTRPKPLSALQGPRLGAHRAPSPSCWGRRSSVLSPQQQKCSQRLFPPPQCEGQPAGREFKVFSWGKASREAAPRAGEVSLRSQKHRGLGWRSNALAGRVQRRPGQR